MPAVIIKADEFKYPSRVELKRVKPETPRLKSFGFPYVHEMIELLNNTGNMENVAKRSHLHWWDHCLRNRLGSLSHAYTTALVHYNRGLPDDVKDYKHQHFVNRAQFGYYGETYFYFFISVRDTIAQLVNVYYSLGVPEKKLFINEDFYKKLPDQKVKDLFLQFKKDTELTSEYRNGLAHRFLLTHPDYRPIFNVKNMVYEAGGGKAITSSELKAEIKRSLQCMAKFLEDLSSIIK